MRSIKMKVWFSKVGLLSTALLVVGTLVLSGCSKQIEGVVLSGAATFDGQPIEEGQIVFEPQDKGVTTVAQITNGAYSLTHERPAVPGKYLARITANRATGKTIAANPRSQDDQATVETEQFIPEQYNLRSQLFLEVTSTQDKHDFTLTSSK